MVRLDHENLFYERQVTPGFFAPCKVVKVHSNRDV